MKLVVLKPDNIGDFVMAAGAIRLLAEAHGEENLILVVKKDVSGLAAREFPRTRVMPLPIRPAPPGGNTSAVNFLACLPVLARLCFTRAGAVVCLRSKRTFLHTLLFVAPRAGRRVACENTLPRSGRGSWRRWENGVRKVFRPILLPYPPPEPGLPSDLGGHRAVVSEVLGRPLSAMDIMPRWRTRWQAGGDFWLMCPLSSRNSKDYTLEKWAAALRGVAGLIPSGGVRLAGGPDQAERLQAFASALRGAGVPCAVHVDRPVALPDFPDVVARAGLLLTVDTSAAHLAGATGTPAVIVTNGNNKGIYAPYSPNGRQIWVMSDWIKGRKKLWREMIAAEEVAGAVREALRGKVEI